MWPLLGVIMLDNLTGKKVVRYRAVAINWPPVVGHGYALYPVDHPSIYVSNSSICYTSNVVAIDFDTGRIETIYTVYIPEKDDIINDLRNERDQYEQIKKAIESKYS